MRETPAWVGQSLRFGLIAPVIFDRVAEYPILVVASMFALPAVGAANRSQIIKVFVPILSIGAAYIGMLFFIRYGKGGQPGPTIYYLFLGATMLAQIMQNVGLKVTPPSQASIIMCLETVFSMVFSVLFYGETVSGAAATGFALIFLAILVSQIRLNGRLLERVGRKAR